MFLIVFDVMFLMENKVEVEVLTIFLTDGANWSAQTTSQFKPVCDAKLMKELRVLLRLQAHICHSHFPGQ